MKILVVKCSPLRAGVVRAASVVASYLKTREKHKKKEARRWWRGARRPATGASRPAAPCTAGARPVAPVLFATGPPAGAERRAGSGAPIIAGAAAAGRCTETLHFFNK